MGVRKNDDRSAIGMKSIDTMGPKPGSPRAISQRKAISEGYEAAPTPRRVNMNQHQGETGVSCAPGITNRSQPKRKE